MAQRSRVNVAGRTEGSEIRVVAERPTEELALLAGLTKLRGSTDLLPDEAALAQRYAEDGYLLLRAILPDDLYMPIFEEAAGILERERVIVHDGDGYIRWTGASRPDEAVILQNMASLELIDEQIAGRTGPLQEWADKLLGQRAYLGRTPIHIMESYPTGPPATTIHQDRFGFGDAGDYRRFWIPLVPIPFGDGGLAIAPGSHRGGIRAIRPIPLERVPEGMATAEFRPGDALLLHTDLIHATVPYTSNRVRLALTVNVCADSSPHPQAWAPKWVGTLTRKAAIGVRRPAQSQAGKRVGVVQELYERQADRIRATAPMSAAKLDWLARREWPVPGGFLVQGWDMPLAVLAGLHYLVLAGETTWDDIDQVDLNEPSETLVRAVHELARPDPIHYAGALLSGLLAADADTVDLIQLGTSSGLLLNLDRFADQSSTAGRTVGQPFEETLGPHFSQLITNGLTVRSRLGIGLDTVDIHTEYGSRILQAFTLPDETTTLQNLRVAIDIAKHTPFELHQGDYVEELPRRLARRARDGLTVVFHVNTVVGLSEPRYQELVSTLRQAARTAPIAQVSLEPRRYEPGLSAATIYRHGDLHLELTRWPEGESTELAIVSNACDSGRTRSR
jgi:1-deoxypentalenic acid 11beta-hydroxylase